jgi:hypothetical protein
MSSRNWAHSRFSHHVGMVKENLIHKKKSMLLLMFGSTKKHALISGENIKVGL